MRRDKKKFYTSILAGFLVLIGLGYAYIHSDLSINGDALFKRATWNIHFVSPPTVSSGSVSGASVTTAAHVIGTNNDTVEYSVTLTNPRDYYEFTVTAENTGTMDAMISTVSNKVYSGNTEITLPDYVKSEISYTNGAKVKEKQLLAANSTQTFKVKVSYRDDIEVSQLPGSDTALSFKFNVTYVQADNTAREVILPVFNDATPWRDVIEGIQDGTLTPTVGDTKKVMLSIDLDNDNEPEEHEYTLRVANTTTPAECSTTGFSQTACGLVLEFVDTITGHVMNSSDTTAGGWRDSEIRSFVNSDIYNALPAELKNAIIDTNVVSSYGCMSESDYWNWSTYTCSNPDNNGNNFITTDKLYLLSTHEVWEDDDGYIDNGINIFDTSYNNTRQLDYYAGQNVSTSNYLGAIKRNNAGNSTWWLRSVISRQYNCFYEVHTYGEHHLYYASSTYGVSPAFRIA